MPYRNFIALADTDITRPIYRVMPVACVLECISNRKLTLVRPKLWDDPFENFLLSAVVDIGRGQFASMQTIKESIYGQCWTLQAETDAIWRIYSPNKNGAKLRSTPKKLLDALMKANKQFGTIQCFIGRVSYLSEPDLISKLQGLNLLDSNGSGLAESLMYKREEFRHEDEVRLVFHPEKGADDLYEFDIDPNDLFDEIVLDPRMSDASYDAYKSAIQRSGFTGSVSKSGLYKVPKRILFRP